MANPEKMTVDKAYFDALLRRAGFHTSTQLLARPDPASVNISRVEYDSLLRVSREYELLKKALFEGGITSETFDLLISGAKNNDQRADSGIDSTNVWTQDFSDSSPANGQRSSQPNVSTTNREVSLGSGGPFNLGGISGIFQNGNLQPPRQDFRVPSIQRHTSYGMYSAPEDVTFDEDEDFEEGNQMTNDLVGFVGSNERRTIYLSGFSERTTYRDLLSVIKGGKLLNVNLRPERSATVTFLDGAAEFLAWAKRNDIYLHAKRIEVKWADRQYRLNGHIAHKIANGATRNVVIRGALEKGFTEAQIRDDMDHIHNLIVIDVAFRGGDAFVSMNSVHNALFARTCMMSRSTYKGCKIEFVRDECDVPLPAPRFVLKPPAPVTTKKKAQIANRFDMLNMDGTDGSSDVENRTPSDDGSEDQNAEVASDVGVSLNILGADSF